MRLQRAFTAARHYACNARRSLADHCQPSPITTPGGGKLSSGTKKSGASGTPVSIR
jgi:hypothetical protein